MNGKVKLAFYGGQTTELDFEHALNLLRNQTKSGVIIFKVIGEHEFINNELIRKPNNKASAEPAKQGKPKGGGKAAKPTKGTNDSL